LNAALRTLALLILLGATAIACLPALDAPFTHDEEAGIGFNRAVQRGATIREAAEYRFSPDQWRPLFFVTLLAEARLHGTAPRGYRIVSLLMHLACGVVLYRLLFRLAPPGDEQGGAPAPIPSPAREGAALAGTAFFLLHPLQSESIIYIWGRSGVQAALLALLALAIVPWPGPGTRGPHRQHTVAALARWAAAPLLTAMALAVKEEAIFLPLVALLWWTLAEGRPIRPAIGRAALLAAPVIGFLALRTVVLGAIGRQVFARSLADNILGQAVVTLRMIRLVIVPVGQSFDPAAAVPPVIVGAAALAVCLLVIAGALAITIPRRAAASATAPALGARWIGAGTLVAAAGIAIYWLVPLPDLMSERRGYLPLAGGALAVCGAVTVLLAALKPPRRSHRATPAPGSAGGAVIAWAPALAVTLLLAPALHSRARLWSDPRGVWEEAMRRAPDRVRPYIDLGVLAAGSGDRAKAAAMFDKALALDPHDPEALYNRGRLRLDAGDLEGAGSDFAAAVAANPTMPRARINLAIVRIRRGDLDGAEEELRAALAIDPGEPRALTNLAEVLRARGRADEAIDLYRRALASDPAYAHAAARLGVTLEARGDPAGALAAYRDYLARGPESDADRLAVEQKIRALEGTAGSPVIH
jgi:Flp pilus assembly protein TadD